MDNVVEYLSFLEEREKIKDVLELILMTTFPNQEMTLKQIRANYMSFTDRDINEETLKAHLDDLVKNCHHNKIYAITEKGHYKFLF